jgi:methionine synthase I (cobalamin-dependent)
MMKRMRAAADESVYERLFAGSVVLCDGAMGTVLCDRGNSIDCCLEELNLSRPEMIAAVHSEYLRAGAEVVETNTFGANAIRLERYGLREKVREINLAGVRIARARVTQMIGSEVLVAGAVGPLGVRLGVDEARDVFAEQIGAVAEGGRGVGVDLLLIETMMSLDEAEAAIRAAREVAPGLRLVVMMTVDGAGNCLDGATAEMAAERLTELGADAVGCNCSDGPESVLRAMERMRAVTHLPLAAMPNAGLPHKVDGRNGYAVTPEGMAEFARRAIGAGASLIGGCCGTSPEHTRVMRSALPVRSNIH